MRLLRPLVLSALLAATAIALPATGRAADPYEINVILPVTGAGAFLAKAIVHALTVIQEMVNRTGGIGGREIKFVVADDQSNPQVAVQLVNGVIAKGVPVFLGSNLAASCNATAALLKDGPVEYCWSPGVHPPAGSYLFSAGVSTVDLLAAGARYFRERGFKRIATMTSNDATGQDADAGIDAVYGRPENRELAIVDREHFNTADISVAAQLAHVGGSGAQALIAWSTGTPFGTVLRGAKDAGLTVPILTTNGNLSYTQMHQYASIQPPELLFTGMPSMSPDQLPGGPLKQAVVTFVTGFNATGQRPEAGENQAWDSTLMVVDALRHLGTGAGATQIRDYITNLRWRGIYGPFDFHAVPQRGVGIDAVLIQRWDAAKDGWIGVSRPGGALLK